MIHLNSFHQSTKKVFISSCQIFSHNLNLIFFSPALCFYRECQPATERSDGRGKQRRREGEGDRAEIVENRHNWRLREASTSKNYLIKLSICQFLVMPQPEQECSALNILGCVSFCLLLFLFHIKYSTRISFEENLSAVINLCYIDCVVI